MDKYRKIDSRGDLLREILGDDPQDSRYIQTVGSLGYRFIAPI
jgi:hypothetical protein